MRELDGARFVRRWRLGKDDYALVFARASRAVLVLWTEGSPRTIRLSHAPGSIAITSCGGKRTVRRCETGATEVKLGKAPAIYDLPGPVSGT